MPPFTTETQIANRALSFLGQSPITDIDATPDASDKVLTSIQNWYDSAVEMVIRDLNYELSTAFVELVELIDNSSLDDETNEWGYVYYLPPSYVNFRRIFSGTYPDSRETTIPHRKISEAAGSAINITGATKADPCVLTVSGLEDGQVIAIASVVGMTQLNGNTYIVSNATATTCEIRNLNTGIDIDSSAYGTYTSGGTATPQAHHRLFTNLMEAKAEVSVIPGISLWPADFAVCVAKKIAELCAVDILGVDRKDMIDKAQLDYIKARNNASGNMAKESFKGVRKLSASTLSRMRYTRGDFDNGAI